MASVPFNVKQECEICRNVSLAGHLLCPGCADAIRRLMNLSDDTESVTKREFLFVRSTYAPA